MHLTIRWKFILSIGITLIVTYLSLLMWDYWWQRRIAAEDMQQRVAENAQGWASTAEASLAAIERQIETITDAIERNQPQSLDAIRSIPALRMLGTRNSPGINAQIIIAFEADFAEKSQLEAPGYQVMFNAPGGPVGPGGRGGGGRGPRGGAPGADLRGGGPREGRGGFPGDGGRGGGSPEGPPPNGRGGAGNPDFGPPPGGRGPNQPGALRGLAQSMPTGAQLEPITNFDRAREPFYARAAELKRAVWSDPHLIRARLPGGANQQPRATFSIPIIIGDHFVGVVAAVLPVPQQFGLAGGFGGPGAQTFGGIGSRGVATAPATRPADVDSEGVLRQFSIIGNEGRVIFPVAPRSTQPRPSIVDWARSSGMPELAQDLTATFEGENSAVKVYRLKDAPDVVPGATAGEYYWVAFAPIATTDWVVTSAISESEHMSPIVQRLWHRALFLIGGLVVLLGVTAFVSIRVSRPIEKMARAVNELARGNLDAHVTEVTSHDEIGQLATAFNTMTGQLKQHVAALTEQTAARETVEAELRIARQIQTDLLPKTFPPFPNRLEFDLYAVNVPAHRVAGDFYDFFFTPDDLLTVVIADVSGKGVPAALLMAVTRTIVRNLAMEGLTPGQIAERANAMLIQDISDSMFVTMFLCQYDTKTGRVVYVNAGHPRPYCFGNEGAAADFGEVTGALLGVVPASPEWPYEQREGRIEVGQTLLLYTDGVTEARSPDGSMLRSAGVTRLISAHQRDDVKDLCMGLVDDVNDYQAGQPADDITLVALKRLA